MINKIWYALKKDDSGPYQHYINSLPKSGKLSWSNGIEVVAAQPIWNLVQFIMFTDGQNTLNDTKIILNHALEGLINADEALLVSRKVLFHWVDLLDNEFRSNQMTLRFTALIPALVTGWGFYKVVSKLYGWSIKSDYKLLRDIVAQINTALIESHGDMNNERYGNLVYLLHKLHHAAGKQIRQKGVQREFVRDIALLSWYDYTIEEKRSLIDNMRWKYDFLSPTYSG